MSEQESKGCVRESMNDMINEHESTRDEHVLPLLIKAPYINNLYCFK